MEVCWLNTLNHGVQLRFIIRCFQAASFGLSFKFQVAKLLVLGALNQFGQTSVAIPISHGLRSKCENSRLSWIAAIPNQHNGLKSRSSRSRSFLERWGKVP